MSTREKFEIPGRVAIVTGASGLLGQQHTKAIAEFGGQPVLVDVDEKGLNQLAEEVLNIYGINSEIHHCDITSTEELINVRDNLVTKFGRIDILINNAAVDTKMADTMPTENRLESFPVKTWEHELSVGLTGAMLCSQIFGPVMVSAGKGVILNISSDLGLIAPDQRLYEESSLPTNKQRVKPVTYSIVKHGIHGLTRYLASYWGDQGIRTNTISLGGVYVNQPEHFVKKLERLIILGRMADPEEYRAAIIFLVSDASEYMIGSNLVIDGGRTVW
ncbi:MAG: oxidoreductase [Acidiferrobacteraceae bacterium]|nr:oxidoreductase [Acidiferrobacteraceae bacterium]